MPRILAVDDSATMRRVLELPFAGQDGIEIVAVADGATAVRAAAQHALDLILADASMPGMDGYEVARTIREAGGQTPIILLASQHTPFDAEKARAAGIDDHVLKPFDTQSMIDKARDVMSRGRKAAGSAAPGARTSTSGTMQSTPAVPRAPAAPVGSPVAAAPKAAPRPTASFGPGSASPTAVTPARPMVPATAVVGARPAPAAAPAAAKKPTLELAEDEHGEASRAPVAAATAAVTAEMAGKLGGMGLTPDQVQGILALSREIVERVVWEVVPELAETIIREEIKRLTS